VTGALENSLSSWNEWRIFFGRIAIKPKKTIARFSAKKIKSTD
jgi:hypothetical protein